MASKLDFYRPKSANQADKLREGLNTLENEGVLLTRKDKAFILSYLHQLDATQALFDTLQNDNGPDLTAEHVRFNSLKEQFQKRATEMIKRFGGIDAFRSARPSQATPENAPWWFLDDYIARQKAAFRKYLTKIGAVVGVIILVLVILFNTVLKPDPIVIFKNDQYNKAIDLAITDQDYAQALSEVEQTLAVVPDDAEFLVFKGVLLEQLNRPDEADITFEETLAVVPGPAYVPMLRGRFLVQLGQPKIGLTYYEEALELNPNFAEAWLLMGQAHILLEQTPEAYNAFSKAADLALEQGKDTIYTTAKINMSYLIPGVGQ